MLFTYEKKTKTALKRCFRHASTLFLSLFCTQYKAFLSHKRKQHKLCTVTGFADLRNISGANTLRTARLTHFNA